MILMLCRPVFPPPEKGAKNTPKSTSSEINKKKKRPDHTKRGNSNVLAQGLFIRVLTVVWSEGRREGRTIYKSHQCLLIVRPRGLGITVTAAIVVKICSCVASSSL